MFRLLLSHLQDLYDILYVYVFVTDIHPPAYEDGTDKEFRNVGY